MSCPECGCDCSWEGPQGPIAPPAEGTPERELYDRYRAHLQGLISSLSEQLIRDTDIPAGQAFTVSIQRGRNTR